MASGSAPRRGHASVAFGSEAEVLPAGSARLPTVLPFRAHTNQRSSPSRRSAIAPCLVVASGVVATSTGDALLPRGRESAGRIGVGLRLTGRRPERDLLPAPCSEIVGGRVEVHGAGVEERELERQAASSTTRPAPGSRIPSRASSVASSARSASSSRSWIRSHARYSDRAGRACGCAHRQAVACRQAIACL
jgi:hypothetical protein